MEMTGDIEHLSPRRVRLIISWREKKNPLLNAAAKHRAVRTGAICDVISVGEGRTVPVSWLYIRKLPGKWRRQLAEMSG